ncbi:OmpA family protein [Streptomyces sp. NPDC127068]|uniref:OmpA family protein n=1 Tax=Streptomyces sp. NPDC127068 TaxID=3347127 RepID=UPI0036603F97
MTATPVTGARRGARSAPGSRTARTTWKACAVPLLVALVSGLLSGCSTSRDPQVACDWMRKAATDAPRGGGQTVILVDASSSVRGSAPTSGGFDHRAAVARHIGPWLADVGTVSVAAFGGDVHDIRWIARGWAAKPRGGGNEENERRRSAAVPECLGRAVAEAQSTVPERGGSDVLGALREARGAFADDEGVRRLIVLTDGLPTKGCADLRHSGFEGSLETDAIVERCLAEGEVTPEVLGSVRTVLVGLGRTARDEPQASPAQSEWISGLWKRLCAAAHPQPARPEDCTLTAAAAESLDEQAAARRPDDQTVEFPQRTYQRAGARALFDTNSSVLLPEALPELTKIAVGLRGKDDVGVRVFGYVDPRGGTANNRSLSQARADAVKNELERLGVRGVTAVGRGVADGCPGSGGDLNENQKLRCDRRVDIVVVR